MAVSRGSLGVKVNSARSAEASDSVRPWKLPPTMMIAPTSETIAARAAMIAAITPILASRSASRASWTRLAPSALAWSTTPGPTPWIAAAVSATT